MKTSYQHIAKAMVLLCIGAFIYASLEILWRGYTHWTMAVLGGLLFLLLGNLNNWLEWDTPLWKQVLAGTMAVTSAEFLAGLILNVWLGLGIWDYSQLPFNILGQICPQFIFIWAVLSLVGIVLDDYIRYWFWDEQKPRYKLF